MPIISVIMPVYNAELYLKAAIESILLQTYEDFELIILNDCSTDNSKVIIEEFAKKDSRILFINKKHNVGPAKLRNEGFEIAQGQFIALMDADDIATETRFEKQLEIFKLNSEIGVCGSWFTNFGDNIAKKVIKHAEHHNEIKARFLIDCTIGNSTAMIRKSIIQNTTYNTDFVPVEDYYFWSILIFKTQFYNIQESLLNYRIHNDNISQTKKENVLKSRLRVKTQLLENLKVNYSKNNSLNFLNLLEETKGLNSDEIKKAIKAAHCIISQNYLHSVFDDLILKKIIYRMSTKIVKKGSNINTSFFKELKDEYPEYYKTIKVIDKIKILIKTKL